MISEKPSVSDIHTGAPASSHAVEQPKKTEVVPTRRRKQVADPLCSSDARPARGQLPDFSKPILGARPVTPAVEKVPLSEIRHRNLIRHQELFAVQEANKKLLKDRQKQARKENRCATLVKTSRKDLEMGREKSICGTFATNRGYCRKHYNLKYLKVPPIQPGAGATMRPFAGWQLPGSMTELQHECLRSLPLQTSYEVCLIAMNLADPNNILVAICEKPGLRKSRR